MVTASDRTGTLSAVEYDLYSDLLYQSWLCVNHWLETSSLIHGIVLETKLTVVDLSMKRGLVVIFRIQGLANMILGCISELNYPIEFI